MDLMGTAGQPRAAISPAALVHNVELMRRAVGPRTRIFAVVKADGYGHRADLVTAAIEPVVDGFAVATLEEAAVLNAGRRPVLVMQPLEEPSFSARGEVVGELLRRGVSLTVCSEAAADDLARAAAGADGAAAVQIMVDTGMARGAPVERLEKLVERVGGHRTLRLEGMYTHFARSEEPEVDFTGEQMRRFHAATDRYLAGGRGLIRHAANSGGTFLHRSSHLDLVRPGISLYGIDPTGRFDPGRPLRPVMKLTAPLIALRDFPRGGRVGYGQTWRAERDTRIGMVPLGYADGYPRNLSNRSVMLVRGRAAPVVGRVSMDLITLDLGPVPDAQVGDEVTVMDDDPHSPCSAYALAEQAGTIAYELFCRVGSRVQRGLRKD